jgi:hypothetical protein
LDGDCDTQCTELKETSNELNIAWKNVEKLQDKLDRIGSVLTGDWDKFNMIYARDTIHKQHPRWKIKSILEEEIKIVV